MTEIYTPSGIGDIFWILQKIYDSVDELWIKIPPGTAKDNSDIINRSRFLLALPKVEKITANGLKFSDLKRAAAKNYPYKEIKPEMFLEANTWLEAGNRIDDYMPDFKTQYKLPWEITATEKKESEKYLSKNKKNIIIYTSSVKNNNSSATGFWKFMDWKPIFEELHQTVNIIWIGAEYDSDALNHLPASQVYINSSPGTIISLLRKCDGFISYQSGLPCISVAEGIPTVMLFFEKIKKMTLALCPQSSIKDRNKYLPLFLNQNPRDEILNWVNNRSSI